MHRVRVSPFSFNQIAVSDHHPAATLSVPTEAIVQELARQAQAQALKDGNRAATELHSVRLLDWVAQRCQTRPDVRRLWLSFQASPFLHMAELGHWLAEECRLHPGFARQLAGRWQRASVMLGKAHASPNRVPPPSLPGTLREGGSALLQSLPAPIVRMWQACVPPALTQSLLDYVNGAHPSLPLVQRREHLARHMVNYLRLAAQPLPQGMTVPRYFDGGLLERLERHLRLPAHQPATRSGARIQAQAESSSSPPPPMERTIHQQAEMECPDRVWVGEALVTVKVRIADPPSAPSDRPRAALHLRPELPIGIWLMAPGFDVLSPHIQMLRLRGDRQPLEVTFELQPQTTGHTYVAVKFLQEGTPLGSMSAPVEIAEHMSMTGRKHRVEARNMTAAVETESPDLTLFVHYDTMQPQPRLLFNLYRAGQLSQTYPPLPLHVDPQAYHAEIYQRLSDMTDLFDIRRHDAETVESLQRAVRSLGQSLWNDLIPQGLQELYALERAEWRDRTLLVVTDEPFIPWELMWPYGYQGEAWEDETPWCMTMRMTRWLHRDGEGTGLNGPPTRMSLARFAFVGPPDMSLAAIQAEGAELKSMMRKAGIADASPAGNSRAEIQALLEAGAYDWFHLASHGEFAAERPDRGSAILLERGEPFTPDALIGPQVQNHLFHRRPGFVLNACHTGRQGWALTQLGGWANRLVGSGAGVFMGPLWTVTDESAKRFALDFYTGLLAGQTVAEALHGARHTIRATGDPTWLAYSVYAHPNARLAPGPGPERDPT